MEEINAAGGVLGAKLELETYDDGGDASTAANGAQKFADDDSILAIGGSCLTSCTAAMLPITGDAEIFDPGGGSIFCMEDRTFKDRLCFFCYQILPSLFPFLLW